MGTPAESDATGSVNATAPISPDKQDLEQQQQQQQHDRDDHVVKKLLARGPNALFDDVAHSLKDALGDTSQLPQLDIRFRNLSIAVDLPAHTSSSSSTTSSFELPTLVNVIKQTLRKLVTTTRVETHYILKDVSGALKPGSMTLVLGQPSAGKSSFLQVLSGRLPQDAHVRVEGDVAYNGIASHTLASLLPQLTAYVPQRDTHYPTLTVHETLAFARACCSRDLAAALKRLESECSDSTDHCVTNESAVYTALAHLPAVVLELLGLQTCKDTVVGDAMLRGISGGETKRVTTGEMLFGAKLALFLDDISTGLDSAATFDIVSAMRGVAQAFGTTVAMSLLQPSPEVVALFDDVVVLNDGYMLYHGPQRDVLSYFSDLGLTCPPGRATADFLLDIGTPAQSRYRQPRTTNLSRSPTTPEDFADVFKRSRTFHAALVYLDAPLDSDVVSRAQPFIDAISPFYGSVWANARAVLARECVLLLRNRAFLRGRAVMIVVMALLYATIYCATDPIDVQVVIGVVFAAAMFLSLGQASQIPTILAMRAVFYKQRRANFYRTTTFVLASVATRVPIALGESVVFGSLLYWMVGFARDAAAFLAFETLLFLTSVALGSWFYLLAVATPNANVAMPLAMVSILFLVTFAGFVIPKTQIPGYLIWLYWLTPLSWVVRSIMVNQYQSPAFMRCDYRETNYCRVFGVQSAGEYFLSLYDVPTERAWIGYGMAFMLAMCVVYNGLAALALEYWRYESSENPTIVRRSQQQHDVVGSSNRSDYVLASTPRATDGNSDDGIERVSVVPITSHAHAKHFVPVTLAFQDLWYTVALQAKHRDDPTSIDLLKGVSGFARPSTMTALMGASGAGKTTLMDVLAARKTDGTIRGRILVNGYDATDTVIRRCAGYCEQIDVHAEASTFREALTFSAFLRQASDVPARVKMDAVDECLDLLDLSSIADKLIRGSSMEQMKRLTIGVELVAQPSVLFLDEPTSGLDAQAAKAIMDGVRNVADSGRTVLCTIHQPSTEVFAVFDSLLLLKKGGETVYFGDMGVDKRLLVEYFERLPGVAPLPQGYNPATWILECIGAGVSSSSNTSGTANSGDATDFVQAFNASALKQALDDALDQDGVTRPSPNVPVLAFAHKRAASGATQMTFLLRRTMATYWRTPSYNVTRIAIAFALALFFAIVFANAEYKTYQGVNAGIGMVFLSTVFSGIVSFFSVLPVAIAERSAFYRERASQTYNALWYFVGITVAEIPYVFGCSAIFTALFFPLVGFRGVTTAVLYWLNTALLILLQTYTGQLLAFVLPTAELAMIVGVLLNSIFFLFMGFNPPTIALPTAYKWLYYVVPKRYSFSILAALVFADCPDDNDGSGDSSAREHHLGCQEMLGVPLNVPAKTVKQYTETIFDARHDEIWSNFAVVLASIAIIRVLGLLALRFINHQKR